MNSSYRWIVLAVFALVAGLSQLLWLNFAPIITLVQSKYGVSESQASLLILVFPLVYVLLSLPSGAYIDKHGYRRGVGLGVIIMTLFAALRIFDQSFTVMLIAQIGIAVAQPYIINGISKLVLDWFHKEQEAIATGLGTMGMFVGMATGMAATPPLVEKFGFRTTMVIFALITLMSAAAFFALVKNNPENKIAGGLAAASNMRGLLKNRSLLVLFFLSFLGLGFFNGLTTWLELILAPRGINSEQAGVAGGLLILGGVVGAAVIPALSDLVKKRKPFLIGSIGVATLTLYPLCRSSGYNAVLIFSALQGFFFLPAFSLLLEMCAELGGEVHAASATSILMLMGNAGGVIVVIAMEWIKGGSKDFGPAVNLLFGILVLSLFLSFVVPETRKRATEIRAGA